MAKILFESEDGFKKKFKKLLTKRNISDSTIDKTVEDIIHQVEKIRFSCFKINKKFR